MTLQSTVVEAQLGPNEEHEIQQSFTSGYEAGANGSGTAYFAVASAALDGASDGLPTHFTHTPTTVSWTSQDGTQHTATLDENHQQALTTATQAFLAQGSYKSSYLRASGQAAQGVRPAAESEEQRVARLRGRGYTATPLGRGRYRFSRRMDPLGGMRGALEFTGVFNAVSGEFESVETRRDGHLLARNEHVKVGGRPALRTTLLMPGRQGRGTTFTRMLPGAGTPTP